MNDANYELGNRRNWYCQPGCISNKEPNKKCCTTGNFDRHSTSYIFSNPLFILYQEESELISNIIGDECLIGPFFIYAELLSLHSEALLKRTFRTKLMLERNK